MSKIRISINGKEKEVEATTIEELLMELQVTGNMFVVEKNREIVHKENYSTEKVSENDSFELVGFFGGG